MNTRTASLMLIIVIGFTLSACGPGQLFGPTLTPTPTQTPTATPIPLGQITGRIFVDGINQPYVTDVNLYNSGTKNSIAVISTDTEGYFSFEDVEPGEYVLWLYISLPDPFFTASHCKLSIGGEEGWNFSGDVQLVGSSFSMTGVKYESDIIEIQGETMERNLNLLCE